MKALVTGANSFVGANLVRALLQEGYGVRAFVRPTSDIQNLNGLDVDLAYGNVLGFDSLVKALKGCQVMFHAAAIFSYSGHTSKELEDVAIIGTTNVIKAAKLAKIQRVVLTSSSIVIGSTEQPTILDEKNTSKEIEPGAYAISKIKQEEIAFEYAKNLGVNLVVVCPTICVGPHDYRLSESNAIILNYLKDPFRATWPGGCNIVSVEDVARGHLIVAQSGKKYERYILGSQNLYWNDVHRIISELTGIQGPLLRVTHTYCLLAAVTQEMLNRMSKHRPLVTRAQAKMVGRYYWYNQDKAMLLGYNPMSSRQALAKAISWLSASHHVTASLRSTMTLSREVYEQR